MSYELNADLPGVTPEVIATNEKIKNIAGQITAFDGCDPSARDALAALDCQLAELTDKMERAGFRTNEVGNWVRTG